MVKLHVHVKFAEHSHNMTNSAPVYFTGTQFVAPQYCIFRITRLRQWLNNYSHICIHWYFVAGYKHSMPVLSQMVSRMGFSPSCKQWNYWAIPLQSYRHPLSATVFSIVQNLCKVLFVLIILKTKTTWRLVIPIWHHDKQFNLTLKRTERTIITWTVVDYIIDFQLFFLSMKNGFIALK